MAFQKANILTTRESAFGQRWLGQIVAVPSGRLDKISLYLEPVVADSIAAQSVNVIVEVYDLGISGYPTGTPLASDYAALSDISIRGFHNFRLEAYVPTVVAIVVRVPNGDDDNHVAWRYVSASSGGEELLLSSDDGATWSANPTRKFSYRTFSLKPNAIDVDNQTAAISAGTLQSTTDSTGSQFSLGELDRTAVTGDTVAINFGDFVITLVLDQSGSMTWNDKDGLRFDFLKDFATDIDASLPVTSTATYSLIKFRGRRVGKMTIGIAGDEETGLHLDGIRIVRKAGSPPTSITDGCIVFEGLAEQFEDLGALPCPTLSTGTQYYYAAFAFADLGGNTYFASGQTDYGFLTTPVKAPLGVAGLASKVVTTDGAGVPLTTGATDFGFRKVSLTWLNAAGFDYSTVTLVRRDDRPPESPIDGTVLLSAVPAASNISYTDTLGGTYAFPNGLTYYYAIFTTNALGIKCGFSNAAKASALITSALRPWELLEPPANVPPFGFDVTPPGQPVVTIVESNGEIRLSWVAADSDTKRYKLFYDPKKPPATTNDKASTYSGEVLFDGTGTTFTHRSLSNGQPHFYVLIAIDAVENVSLPVRPMVGTRPPKPDADATVFLPPDPVSNFEVEIVNAANIRLSWTNPKAQNPASGFYFGDSVRVVANVEFLDPGVSENFITFEFVEKENSRQITAYDPTATIDPNLVLNFAHVPSISANTIISVVSINPLKDVQNLVSGARITLNAALRVKSRATGAVIAEIKTGDITVSFTNPFDLAIKNEPEQMISRRTWKLKPDSDPGLPCQEFEYSSDSFPGVYVNSGKGFSALIESSYRGLPLSGPLDVTISLLDKKTGLPTKLLQIPQTLGETTAVLQTSNVTDETLDRSGEPTGDQTTRSVLPFDLPPSGVSGDFVLQATAEYLGYKKTVQLDVHYEPILNIDLNLTPFSPDNVDRTEQSAYVYLAPFDADQSQKVPVDDFTVTDWSIRPLCKNSKRFDLQSEDSVPGLGIKAYTRGGLAQKIFWGPGEIDTDELFFEVSVKATVGGMVAQGFGMLQIGDIVEARANKIFLRNADGSPASFSTSQIFADGTATTTWHVIARPEDDAGDDTSGQAFRNAVVVKGGNVPSLDDGRIVTLKVEVQNDTDPNKNGLVAGEKSSIVDSVRIKTNMTGPNGKAGSAKAKIVNGLATFEISVNARVPEKKDTISEEELIDNLFYSIYGIQFAAPTSGVSLALTAYTSVEINGRSISFIGGGSNLRSSAPPCFVELLEPLEPA